MNESEPSAHWLRHTTLVDSGTGTPASQPGLRWRKNINMRCYFSPDLPAPRIAELEPSFLPSRLLNLWSHQVKQNVNNKYQIHLRTRRRWRGSEAIRNMIVKIREASMPPLRTGDCEHFRHKPENVYCHRWCFLYATHRANSSIFLHSCSS